MAAIFSLIALNDQHQACKTVPSFIETCWLELATIVSPLTEVIVNACSIPANMDKIRVTPTAFFTSLDSILLL